MRGRVLVMAGGTGGHVYPALAVAENLARRGWQIDWVGTDRGIESRLVPAAGFPLHRLKVLGLRGKGWLARARGVVYVLWSLAQALIMLRRLKPDVVLGMGGYASGPAGLAAVCWRRPLVIHEQNAVAGTTNRILARFASRVLSGLGQPLAGHPRLQQVGNPVRPDIAALHFAERPFAVSFDEQRPLRVLVLGGSLGAAVLNERIPGAMSLLASRDQLSAIEVRHQCGRQHEASTREAWRQVATSRVILSGFIENMAEAYGWADLVICRAGALTVSELAAAGKASVLVPLPHAIDDHQTQNARSLSDINAAILLPQSSLTPVVLADLIASLLAEPRRLEAMAFAARKAARLNATDVVADVVEEVANVR